MANLGFLHEKEPMTVTPDFELVKRMPRYHKEIFYVQGFKFLSEESNTIVESAGRYGFSSLHLLNLDSMTVEKKNTLDSSLFGEGCDWVINRVTQKKEVHQMTYRERTVFVYDQDLKPIRQEVLPQEMKEGWGIKRFSDSKGEEYFYTTDGSDRLFIVDPVNWKVISSTQVLDTSNQPVYMLNEMEMIGGYLYINLYLSYYIAKVNPNNNFRAEHLLDFKPLSEEVSKTPYYRNNRMNYSHCFNGIAYNSLTKKCYVTGKDWPMVYEVKLNL